jgi:hypothetical protein
MQMQVLKPGPISDADASAEARTYLRCKGRCKVKEEADSQRE